MLVLKIYVTILWVIWMRTEISSGDRYACEPEKVAKFLHKFLYLINLFFAKALFGILKIF
jgi:hypothetical protein